MPKKLPTLSSSQQKSSLKEEGKKSEILQQPKVRPGSFAELISK